MVIGALETIASVMAIIVVAIPNMDVEIQEVEAEVKTKSNPQIINC